MTIYVVRHAHAGSRGAWGGDDIDRPLDERGRRQAERIATLLVDRPVGAVWSSPARRCIETVEGIAGSRGLQVRTTGCLFEGSAGDEAVAFALEHAADDPVLCSHGDLIPKMLRRFTAGGMRSTDGSVSTKGSLWVLDTDDAGNVVRGTYHPPE